MKKTLMLLSLVSVVMFTTQSCKKNKGCTNPAACNFDADAKKDDGSCELGQTWYLDADGDGLGNALVSSTSCTQPSGYVSNNTDPNDVGVSKRQRAVVTYVGATWCPPCGAYGDPTKIHMESAHGSDVIILNVQSGDLISSSSEFGPKFGGAFQSFASVNSIPHAYWSGHGATMKHRGFYTSASSNNSAADNDINAIKGNNPECGIGAFASKSGNTITVKTKAIFYNAVATPYYIGVYLLEDGVVAMQQMSTGPAVNTDHNNVVRAAATGSTGLLGTASMGSSFTANQVVDGNYTITANSSWASSNLQVAVVVWKGNAADKISNAVLVNVY